MAFILCIFLFFVHHRKICYAENNLHDCRARGCETDSEDRNRHNLTHKIGNRDSHSECADNTLNHNKLRSATAIEIACEAEKEAGEQAVDGIRLEILGRIVDNFALAREYARKNIAMEE